MTKKKVRVTLLVEDRALERFTREVLLECGFTRHEMRFLEYPVGRGSAKQWVTQRYPECVRAHRSRVNHQSIALLLGTDADELTVVQRQQQLSDALHAGNLAPRTANERIALWIPRWNVETWLLALSHEDVDENEDPKNRAATIRFEAAAPQFVEQLRSVRRGDHTPTLPSLLVAYAETDRIPEIR